MLGKRAWTLNVSLARLSPAKPWNVLQRLILTASTPPNHNSLPLAELSYSCGRFNPRILSFLPDRRLPPTMSSALFSISRALRANRLRTPTTHQTVRFLSVDV